jgi:hypothetical protein
VPLDTSGTVVCTATAKANHTDTTTNGTTPTTPIARPGARRLPPD